MDPPFTKLDILTCRNLLIYLDAGAAEEAAAALSLRLKPGGMLLLGSAETDRRGHRSLRAAGRQDAALPAAGTPARGRA